MARGSAAKEARRGCLPAEADGGIGCRPDRHLDDRLLAAAPVYPLPGLDVLGIGARPVQVAAWNRDHGFTQPVVVQYWHYVDGLLQAILATLIS